MEGEIKTNKYGTGSHSRLATKCRTCMYKEYCTNKRLENEAYTTILQQQISIDASVMKNYDTTVRAVKAISKAMAAVQGKGCI